jgi:uracil-DNA glycosylase
MSATVPPSWQTVLGDETAKPYFRDLIAFVATERQAKQVFPKDEDLFAALQLTPYDDVNVVILGQDPYHDVGQAHGLCFSVKPPTEPPPSLRNIFKELETDLGCTMPATGDLTPWARQGVLLLNAVLTVVAHKPNSHKGKGWETFSDAVIRKVNEKTTRVVFCLWGGYARKKAKLVDTSRHVVVEGAHPSPLSAKQFLGSRPFSAINRALVAEGKAPIEWQLPTSQP